MLKKLFWFLILLCMLPASPNPSHTPNQPPNYQLLIYPHTNLLSIEVIPLPPIYYDPPHPPPPPPPPPPHTHIIMHSTVQKHSYVLKK